jgi:transposase InsO family protein
VLSIQETRSRSSVTAVPRRDETDQAVNRRSTADGSPSPVWLPDDYSDAATAGLAGQSQTGASTLEAGWSDVALQVPQKQHKRRRLGQSDNGCVRLKPESAGSRRYANLVWSIDFLYDTLDDGRQLKIMPILDEYTRQCLSIVSAGHGAVARSIPSKRVITAVTGGEELKRLFQVHGYPKNLRSDNGPEFIAEGLKQYLSEQKIETRYIEPGAPWQNGYIPPCIGG